MFKIIFILSIKFYRYFISPFLPISCRFEPSCSNYAIQAISKFGVLNGVIISIIRILKCNPYGKSGLDPVPEKFKLFNFIKSKMRKYVES